MTKKELFFTALEDSLANLFYYDRKYDEELTVEDVKQLIESKELSKEEVIIGFRKELDRFYIGV